MELSTEVGALLLDQRLFIVYILTPATVYMVTSFPIEDTNFSCSSSPSFYSGVTSVFSGIAVGGRSVSRLSAHYRN